MVQHILSAMGSDEVNNYNDTVESYAVAMLIRQCFYDAAVELGLPEHESMFELDPSLDPSKPCIMFIPTTCTRLDKIYYDNKLLGETHSNMVELKYVPFNTFITMQNQMRNNTTGVGEQVVTNNGESFNFMYGTNTHPTYYTTMDDYTVLFNSFNNTVDTTLMKSKTMCYGAVYPSFTMSNTAVPDLDPTQFPYLLAKAKTRAFNEIKQQVNQESAAEARKQKIIIQKRQNRVTNKPEVLRGPRYGRK